MVCETTNFHEARERVMRSLLRGIVMSLWIGACVFSTAPSLMAQELKIGYKTELTSADPHVLNGPNRNILNHVYESLVASDSQLRPVPSLAVSWQLVSPLGWEFKLRPGVKFQNGAPLTAEDVKFSLERAMRLSGPRTYRSYLKDVQEVVVAAPLVVRIKTRTPSPALPQNVGLVAIVPHTLGNNVSEESFSDSRFAIGTGPYRYVRWDHGQRFELTRNPDYWGDKEPWEKVSFQFIPREPARAAALMSGAVDIITDVTVNMGTAQRNFLTQSTTSYMLLYLAFDEARDQSPFIRGADGAPLTRNPFKNPKVRAAVMAAISREGLINHLMKRDATLSEQLVPAGFFGYDPTFKLPGYDVARAKTLLAEAGYPQGFGLTLHCPNNRFVNDTRLCEALAQALTQIGIRTEVVTLPFSVFLTRLAGSNGDSEFSAFMMGTGAVTGDSLTLLSSLIHSYDKKIGLGANNYGRYSNEEVDGLIDQAMTTTNEESRIALQKKATRLALEDGAVIPLMNMNAMWAMRKGLSITPRADGFTMARDIRNK
jgi:peptide/nickel transport system substrate-binding protein